MMKFKLNNKLDNYKILIILYVHQKLYIYLKDHIFIKIICCYLIGNEKYKR